MTVVLECPPARLDVFWSNVDQTVESGCWEWTGARTSAGYGASKLYGPRDAKVLLAHRVAYELIVGPIPDDRELDHLCRVKHCVNPAHLEPVTHAENMRRATALITVCKHGHTYDAANTAIQVSGRRRCRRCHRDRERARKAAARLAVAS